MFEGKRLLPVFIYQILRQYSSKNRPLSQAEIIRYLEEDYDVPSIDRRTISRCLNDFELVGWPVHRNKRTGVYLAEVFTETELKVLMAPMFMAAYLSDENISKLMAKIGKINAIQRKKVSRNTELARQYRHVGHDDFLRKIEMIDYAQDNRKMLQFVYNDINETGELVPRLTEEGSSRRIVHPYGMMCVDGFYYFVCSKGDSRKLLNYRIDKMTNVIVLDEPALPISTVPGYERGIFSPSEYVKQNFKMFNTPPVPVRFKIVAPTPDRVNFYINTVWDEFGNRVENMRRLAEDSFEFEAKVPLFGAKIFAMQYANVAEVLSPAELRQELYEVFKGNVQKYKGQSNGR